MKNFYLLFLVLGIFSVNVFASHAPASNGTRMCVSAYLAYPVRDGEDYFLLQGIRSYRRGLNLWAMS